MLGRRILGGGHGARPQFVGSTRSVVYASLCYEPFSNFYSVTPDGSDLHEIGGHQAVRHGARALAGRLADRVYVGAIHRLQLQRLRVGDPRRDSDGNGTRVLADPGTDCSFDARPPGRRTRRRSSSPRRRATPRASSSPCLRPAGRRTISASPGNSPAWGPSRIAYVDSSGPGALWTANPDGSDPVQVGEEGHRPGLGVRRAPRVRAEVTRRSSSAPRRSSSRSRSISSLAWSPDGTRFIVTARTKGSAAPDLYTVSTDGTGLRHG